MALKYAKHGRFNSPSAMGICPLFAQNRQWNVNSFIKWAALERAVLGPKKSTRPFSYMGYVRKSRYSLREEKEMGRSYQEEGERISSHLRGLSDLRAGTLCRPNQAH
jgi:hypothetical protein